MLTDRQKRMIEYYLPSPRDETLAIMEYYAKDNAGRVHRVYIQDINPSFREDTTLYGVRYSATGKAFDAGFGYGHTHMYELYDNAQDCRDQTHPVYDRWEELRKLAEAEKKMAEVKI